MQSKDFGDLTAPPDAVDRLAFHRWFVDSIADETRSTWRCRWCGAEHSGLPLWGPPREPCPDAPLLVLPTPETRKRAWREGEP